jgi:hypothetical protein
MPRDGAMQDMQGNRQIWLSRIWSCRVVQIVVCVLHSVRRVQGMPWHWTEGGRGVSRSICTYDCENTDDQGYCPSDDELATAVEGQGYQARV